MNILLTGITSKISMELIPLLLASNHSIVGITRNKAYSNPFNIAVKNIDLSQEFDFDEDIDAVIHLAAYVPYNHKDTDRLMEYCIQGNVACTSNVLNFASKKRVKKFIYGSTVEIYGSACEVVTKDTKPKPDTIYGKTKEMAERLCLMYENLSDLEVVILRIGPLYGKGLSDKLFLKKLVNTSKNEDRITLSNLDNRIPLLHIKDLASCMLYFLKPEAAGIYNLVNNEAVSIKEIVETLNLHLGKKLSIDEMPSATDSASPVYETEDIEKYLGRKKIIFKEGILDVINDV